MVEGLNIEKTELWLTLSGLTLAILDFTGLKIVLDNYVDSFVSSLHNHIFENRTMIADWLENLCIVILDFGIEAVKLAWGIAAILILGSAFFFVFSIFALIFSLGFGWPILAFCYTLVLGGFALVLPEALEIIPYVLASLGVITILYAMLWGVMKIAQPVVLFFPWSALLPIYWLLKGLNMFPGRTLGTIGLLIALASTLSQLAGPFCETHSYSVTCKVDGFNFLY